MKQHEHVLLISGATLCGLGAAVAGLEAGRKVIVIERTALVGNEFIEALNPGKGWEKPSTPFAQKIHEELLQRSLMEGNGPIHLPALHPVLCLLIKKHRLDVRFLTEITEVVKKNGKLHVTLFDAAGNHNLIVDEILDTSSERLTQPGNLYKPSQKCLNAYLHHPQISDINVPSPINDEMSIVKGRFSSEVILKLSVDAKCDWSQARQRLHQYWMNRPADWASWTISVIAGAFESNVQCGQHIIADQWNWLPSEAFEHPLAALDYGYDHYLKLVEKRNETETFDLIVVGLGTAGAIAAIAAARKGLRVLGIDRHTCMGGTGTAGGVIGYYFGSRGGLFEEIDKKTASTEKSVYTPSYGVNAEGKQYVLEQEALKTGVSIHYDTTVTGVLMVEKTVKGLICFSATKGSYKLNSTVIIDGTGNADICRLAGCELRGGREFDGQGQPFSNVVFLQEKERVRAAYTDSGYVFPDDPVSMSKAIVESALLSTHLKQEYNEERRLIRIAPQLGIREGQFIVGEENVTLEQFLKDRYSSQPVFMAYSNLDNHSKDIAFESDLQRDWTVASNLWGLKFTVPIPLGALIPKGYEGLLVAGRSLAVDHDMASCVRMKRDMQKCGEAAAMAAYLAVKNQISLRSIPYEDLAALLIEAECLTENREVFFEHRVGPGEEQTPAIKWLNDFEEIKSGLSSNKPGIAIWSAKRLNKQIHHDLLKWMDQEVSENLRKHSAIALALNGAIEAAPVLREMVQEKDSFVPKTSLKYNQPRGYTAVYLLGKLEDKEAVPELLHILKMREGFTYVDDNKEFLSDEQDLRFQYVSYALMALARIGDCHEETRNQIEEAFVHFLTELDESLVISFKGSTEIFNVMDDKIRQLVDQTLLQWKKKEGVVQ